MMERGTNVDDELLNCLLPIQSCDVTISIPEEDEDKEKDKDNWFISFIMWNMKLKQASKSSEGSCTRNMADNCTDFISGLPDHLPLHIFSFLDETAVFQSSVLSRRWRYLWSLVPFPTAIKKIRSYFKDQKAAIRKEKHLEEEEAGNTIYKHTITVAKTILQSFFIGLPFITDEFKVFVVMHTVVTLVYMVMVYLACSLHQSSLCRSDTNMKLLQERDFILTSNANSHSTTKIPRMELLFPDNYEPRYAKSAKLYGLIGMLLLFIISCSLIMLKWKFDFKRGRGILNFLSIMINMEYYYLIFRDMYQSFFGTGVL